MAKDISANIELKGGTLETNADIHGLIPVKGKATQSDWNEADPSSDAYIKNKPNIDEKIVAILPTDTASGPVAYFPDGADGVPLKSLVIDIKPVQDTSSGVLSPDNICPISGWTGMKLKHTNANLLPENLPDNIISGTTSGDKIASASNAKIFAIPVPKHTALHIQKKSTDRSACGVFLLETGTPKIGDAIHKYQGFTNIVNHDIDTDEYGWLGIESSNLSGAETLFTTREFMVSIGKDRKEYVAPSGYMTIPISWEAEAGTVYGGKLDVRSGKLTVYPYYASYNGETLTGEWISDRDVYAEGATPTIGAQVVNIGAEGTEIQLEPHEVRSLLGTNNILADTGDTSAEYKANIQLYIQKKIAE